jgi:hypothetical protein
MLKAKPHLWLLRFIGVIVPRRFRARWHQEWEAELQYREAMLARSGSAGLAKQTGIAVAQPGRILGRDVAAATTTGGRHVSRPAFRRANVAENSWL